MSCCFSHFIVSLKYLKKYKVTPGGEAEMFSSKFRSSCLDVPPGYSSYSSNALESFWSALDDLHEHNEAELEISELFDLLEGDFINWKQDNKFSMIFHKPCGPQLMQAGLMRGKGLLEVRGGLYDKQFRRQTVEKLFAAQSYLR